MMAVPIVSPISRILKVFQCLSTANREGNAGQIQQEAGPTSDGQPPVQEIVREPSMAVHSLRRAPCVWTV